MTEKIILDENETADGFLNSARSGTFLVPNVHAHTVMLKDLRTNGHKASWCMATVGRLQVRCLRITVGGKKDTRRRNLYQAVWIVYSTRDLDLIQTVVGHQILPMIVLQDAVVGTGIATKKGADANTIRKQEQAIHAYFPILMRLAQISGKEVMFHARNTAIEMPEISNGNILHIYSNVSPPGETTPQYVETVFGLRISFQEKNIVGCGPTMGRGTVLTDQEDKNVLQILGNNWYILFPTIDYFNEQTSQTIFENVLALGWKSLQSPPTRQRSLGRRQWLAQTRSWMEIYEEGVEKEAEKMRREIASILQRAAELQRDLVALRSVQESMKTNAFKRDFLRRMPRDLKRIQTHALVARVEYLEQALHVITRPLTVEHEGVSYLVGAFTIRINSRGAVSVWSEAPTHQKRISHPHISNEGTPCYGNAGAAIAMAAGEARYADAINYILTWLTRGYSPNLADAKIEQWPIAQEVTYAT